MPLWSKGKSVLMTPDPYHTPGYCGFCPQFKFQIGETFGRTTSRLLTNPKVACSGQPVLADIGPVKGPDSQGTGETKRLAGRADVLRSRRASFGDQKLGETMVPGYTGYIPKGEHYFGDRYAENCRNAIAEFEQDQRSHQAKTTAMQRVRHIQAGRIQPTDNEKKELRCRGPLKPIKKDITPVVYGKPNEQQHSTSPYYMAQHDPQKFFMSGYTGFIPKARGLIGMSYPIITNHALNEFTSDPRHAMSRLQGALDKGEMPVIRGCIKLPRLDPNLIYPTESGLVPHYTGHIPGQKFRYGTTFGHSTRNAKRVQAGMGEPISSK
ncbi:protein FAM166B-like [Patiria miniata]|uniref:Ciliary microtubule inner protein 2A-C-like domain-containing protein n=1 Tax=Patiria miniata TaxID=46514 RepID=A0A913Z141_PATMI|nr:protein FAM166B-like [Patiria miniata]